MDFPLGFILLLMGHFILIEALWVITPLLHTHTHMHAQAVYSHHIIMEQTIESFMILHWKMSSILNKHTY